MEILTDGQWIQALKQPGNEVAIAELRRQLARGLSFALVNRVPPEQLNDLVEDFAQDATLRVMQALDTFRGESRFLTWATKVAVRLAFSELRRKRWQDVSLDGLLSQNDDTNLEESNALLTDPASGPETVVNKAELVGLVERLIDQDLTPRQREALRAMIESDMPLEELARRMGTSRNAFYKMIHDARQRLIRSLEQRGVSVQDLLAAAAE